MSDMHALVDVVAPIVEAHPFVTLVVRDGAWIATCDGCDEVLEGGADMDLACRAHAKHLSRAALLAAGLPALLERVEEIECTCEANGPEQHLVPCPRSSFGKVLEAFKREHRWRMEVTAERDALAAKVAECRDLVKAFQDHYSAGGGAFVQGVLHAVNDFRAALDASETP